MHDAINCKYYDACSSLEARRSCQVSSFLILSGSAQHDQCYMSPISLKVRVLMPASTHVSQCTRLCSGRSAFGMMGAGLGQHLEVHMYCTPYLPTPAVTSCKCKSIPTDKLALKLGLTDYCLLHLDTEEYYSVAGRRWTINNKGSAISHSSSRFPPQTISQFPCQDGALPALAELSWSDSWHQCVGRAVGWLSG